MRAWIVVFVLSVSTTSAKDVSVAREHYQRGTKLYDLQRYEEAAKEYEAAYEIVVKEN